MKVGGGLPLWSSKSWMKKQERGSHELSAQKNTGCWTDDISSCVIQNFLKLAATTFLRPFLFVHKGRHCFVEEIWRKPSCFYSSRSLLISCTFEKKTSVFCEINRKSKTLYIIECECNPVGNFQIPKKAIKLEWWKFVWHEHKWGGGKGERIRCNWS